MTRPNFFLIGGAKCATTSLYHYLKQHPDVFMCSPKEPHHFSFLGHRPTFSGPVGIEAGFNNFVIVDSDEYSRLFVGADEASAVGDASTSYSGVPGVAKRIYEYNPDARIICIVRNPVDRAVSMYKHLVRDGYETLPLHEALDKQADRARAGWHFYYQYSSFALMTANLEEYQALFPPGRVMIRLYDDLRRQPVKEVQEIYRFLSIDHHFKPNVKHQYNKSGQPINRGLHDLFMRRSRARHALQTILPRGLWTRMNRLFTQSTLREIPIDRASRARLRADYHEEIIRLARLLNRDLSDWSSPLTPRAEE